MSICFTPLVRDAATDAWLLPPAVHDDPDSYELSLSNANGAEVLPALGIAPDTVGDPYPIGAFAALVTAALRRHLGRRSPELAPTEDAEPGRATFVFLGRREGYIEERLGDLARFVQRSRAAGATHLSWG